MSSVLTDENPLRLTHCMRCGYAMETLAPEGTCPECGISYDQETVVLKGIWAGNGNIATGSRGTVITQVGALCLWVLIAWTAYRSGNHFYAIAFALFFGASQIIDFAYRFHAVRAGAGGALLQCRFNRFGCLQCDLPEEMLGVDDPRGIWHWVTQLGWFGVAAVWCVTHRGNWFWIGLIAVLLGIRARAEWRRQRALRFAKEDPDARALMTAARNCGRQVAATPWSAIADIRVGQFQGTSGRWYLTSKAGKLAPKRDQAINAEVEATADQIRELKARIAAWQLALRGERSSR